MDMILEQFKTIFDRPEKVKRLRETIINLAVRGKIVGQDDNDDLVEKTFESILSNRKDTFRNVFENEIPSSWKLFKHSELFEISGGSQPPKSKFSDKLLDGYIRLYQIRDYGEKPEPVFIPINTAKKISQKGDILLARYGASLGKVFIAEDGAYNVALAKVNKLSNKEYIDNIYIFYYYKSDIYQDFIKGKSRSAQAGFNKGDLEELIVPIPPLNEQRRIVEKVNSLMSLCDKLEKVLEKKVNYGELTAKSVFNSVGNVSNTEELEKTLRFILLNFKDLSLGDNAVKELKNCILQLAVQGKLVPQDPNDESADRLVKKIMEEKEILIKDKKIKKEKQLKEIDNTKSFIIPSGWSLVRLGSLAKIIEYGTSTKADLDDNKVPVLRMNNIVDGKLDYRNLKYVDSDIKDLPRLYLNNKDILFNRTNSYELVGKTAVFTGLDNTMTFASYLIRVALFNNRVSAEYINIVMNSNIYRVSQIEPEITQQNGQANFNGTKLKSTIIPLPPLEEQKRIVEKVESLLKLCDKLEKKIEKQKVYSNRLMESILKNQI